MCMGCTRRDETARGALRSLGREDQARNFRDPVAALANETERLKDRVTLGAPPVPAATRGIETKGRKHRKAS